MHLHWKADGSEQDQLITLSDVRHWVRESRDSRGEPLIEWRLSD